MRWLIVFLALCLPASAQTFNGLNAGSVAPVSGTGCTAATNFLARTSLGTSDANNYTVLICGLVTDGIITGNLSGARGCGSFLDLFYIWAAPDSTTSLLNICGTSYSPAVVHGVPAFSPNNGYTGVDSANNAYIDTGFNPTTATSPNFTQNSAHMSLWSNTNTTSGVSGGIAMGIGNGIATDTELLPKYNDGNQYYQVNVPTGGSGTANANSTGFYLGNRDSSTTNQGYRNGVNQGIGNITSAAIQNQSMFVLARNENGGASFGSGIQQAATTVGASLTSTQVSKLCNRINTFLTTVNGASHVCP